MISKTIVGVLLLTLVGWGQGYTAPGPGPTGSRFGYRMLRLHDLNGDGIPEYVASRHGDSITLFYQGSVEVRDGATDLQIWQRLGLFQSEQYGRNLGLADWNGDGVQEIVAAAQASPGGSARLDVLDAGTGALITTLTLPAGTATADVGVAIVGGDLNLDGLDEIVVGTVPTSFQTFSAVAPPGQVVIFDSLAPPAVITGIENDFGRGVHVIDDVDFDGLPDLLVTAPLADTATPNGTYIRTGYVEVISSATLGTIWTLRGGAPGINLGELVISTPDLNLDGVDDLAMISFSPTGLGLPHSLVLISAANGATIGFFNLPTGMTPANSLEVVGDIDADGVVDLALIGTQALAPTNFVDLISLTDGRLLERLDSPSSLGSALTSIVLMPDTNSDGNPEILTASPYSFAGWGGLLREELRPVLSALGNGSPSHDLLRVNGSAQLPSRRVDLAVGQPFTIGVDPDLTTGQPTDFIIWGLIGVPNAGSAFTVSGGATFLFPPRVAVPGLPWLFCLTDSVGFDPAAAFPGFQAPWVLGAPFGLPFAIDLTFQGVTISGTNIDITNGVLIHVR